ncbi:unnamed protein product [Allacma fusca]|uniref:Uncharacterized protein n=1 Tax=Allacma fusca TaxID=39272 RepID=A0A8J2K0R7_9HEXA|nr:unnamed protein product [Allacma fusca]
MVEASVADNPFYIELECKGRTTSSAYFFVYLTLSPLMDTNTESGEALTELKCVNKVLFTLVRSIYSRTGLVMWEGVQTEDYVYPSSPNSCSSSPPPLFLPSQVKPVKNDAPDCERSVSCVAESQPLDFPRNFLTSSPARESEMTDMKVVSQVDCETSVFPVRILALGSPESINLKVFQENNIATDEIPHQSGDPSVQ